MNPWIWIAIFIVAGFVLVNLLAFLMSLIVSAAASSYSKKFFGGYQDKIHALLPGKDCGECGCRDCADFADCLMRQELPLSKCPYADPEIEAQIDEMVEQLKKNLEDPRPIRKRRSFFDKYLNGDKK